MNIPDPQSPALAEWQVTGHPIVDAAFRRYARALVDAGAENISALMRYDILFVTVTPLTRETVKKQHDAIVEIYCEAAREGGCRDLKTNTEHALARRFSLETIHRTPLQALQAKKLTAA